ncbi:MAG TPA: DUF362 domain-containing protein [Desulfosarcina sp.]|nr:DUF362 domain-containing protein [Desulfosarcina sp.]
MHQVMIHPATYETARSAVDRAFTLFPQELHGKRVLIKPNVLRASEAAEGIVTHPAVLAAVVDKVATLGPASIIVGDNPGLFSYGANEAAFEKAGLMAAAKGYYRNIGNHAVSVPFHPDFMETVKLSEAIVEADVIISLPKFKTHGLTVMTGAIKNSYGFLPGAQKARLHMLAGNPERFHDLVVEVFRLRIPDLFIMDAVVGMEGNGPASPDLREIGMILASDNAVAMDAVAATMMGLDPGRLRFLANAAQAGLGSWRMADIRIDGKLEKLEDFKVPPLGGEAIRDNAVIQEMLVSKTLLTPRPDPDRCTACGACVEQCPAAALSIEGDLPVADMDRCVTCFCCQEICPEKAMVLA